MIAFKIFLTAVIFMIISGKIIAAKMDGDFAVPFALYAVVAVTFGISIVAALGSVLVMIWMI